MTDAELIGQILGGNSNAFRFLIVKYEKLVSYMVFRIIQQHEDAQDVCQDVFLKIFKDLKSYRGESKLSTWIASVAYKTSVNHLRKLKRSRLVNFDDLRIFENSSFHRETPEKELADEEMKVTIRKMLMELPVNYRTVITLYHLEEFTYPEISSITGMPEGTVKNYIFRARKLLYEKLKQFAGDGAVMYL